ncbi:DUF302 domain-containing protein [Herbaspirillum sp. AP02]|uniref:DUF302 domain-containing protein n=1 Tax=unclassified Herbaspirillum TaxID=2624150 RepID=UPI0015D9C4C1|nr:MULTISPECIES: DUF302 domain-containing protein [unclassified Herbaspirillum]MBG7619389.1 DUF302 domain-containing protein [Herbaspirillum sp. AP02]NZD66673.1 DUF302 domain-containing protein [Herbaspirillum sp. AP21]
MNARLEGVCYAPANVLSIRSRLDFKKTHGLLISLLRDRGLTLFADIDQQAAAAHKGLSLRPTRVLLFGNPALGTPIMLSNPRAALELPLKVVIWETADGRTYLDYADPSESLRADYEISDALLAPLMAVRKLLCAFSDIQ